MPEKKAYESLPEAQKDKLAKIIQVVVMQMTKKRCCQLSINLTDGNISSKVGVAETIKI